MDVQDYYDAFHHRRHRDERVRRDRRHTVRRLLWPTVTYNDTYASPTDQFFANLSAGTQWLRNLISLYILFFFFVAVPAVLLWLLFSADGPFSHQVCSTLPTTDSNTGITSTYQSCSDVGPFG